MCLRGEGTEGDIKHSGIHVQLQEQAHCIQKDIEHGQCAQHTGSRVKHRGGWCNSSPTSSFGLICKCRRKPTGKEVQNSPAVTFPHEEAGSQAQASW